jgi:thiamine-phosphate pyrophosphorylase
MRLYYITDSSSLAGDLPAMIRRATQAGIEMVQIREKHLGARELLELTRAAVRAAEGTGAKILVNTRADVAIAAAADGVHLPAGSMSPTEIRRAAPSGFVVGVSCHAAAEVRQAASEGADFVVFGPVFETASKRIYGAPQGLERLRAVCRAATIPVVALGGISIENAAACLEAGAAGVAGISLFQQAADLPAVVESLRAPPGA